MISLFLYVKSKIDNFTFSTRKKDSILVLVFNLFLFKKRNLNDDFGNETV